MVVTSMFVLQSVVVSVLAIGQCEPEWADGFASVPTGTNGTVRAFTVFDDGTGPALYVGGDFTIAGGVSVNYIAKWDGKAWSALGTGVNNSVYALAAFDADGEGPSPPALYAGGSFTTAGGVNAARIARWNGTSWSLVSVGMNNSVFALFVFDPDGAGPAMPELYAGGGFTSPARTLAKWNGVTWSAVGDITAPGPGGTIGTVYALATFDAGSGPMLYAAGGYIYAPHLNSNGCDTVVRLNRNLSWETTGFLTCGFPVNALAVFDTGGGPSLYAGGNFGFGSGGAVSPNIAKWDGVVWSTVGTGLSDAVYALAVYDAGFGRALYAASGGTITKWNGDFWSGVGTGSPGGRALQVFDDGLGPSLYVGGGFTSAGGVSASRIAKTNGSAWAALRTGEGASDTVEAFDVVDIGGGVLYARGSFRSVGNLISHGIAEWDGSAWRALAGGVTDGDVRAIAAYDDGSGSGPDVIAAGAFSEIGGVAAENIAKWDGASWSPLGSGTNLPVDALAVYDDGNGPMLYAACDFFVAGGVPVNRIAKWDGQSWTPLGELGSGLAGGSVNALVVFDDGTGAQLYVGGEFT